MARAFLERHIDEYDAIIFNHQVGDGTAPGIVLPDYLLANTRILGAKYADILGIKGDVAEIIEVKVRALLAAIGQVLGYRVLLIAKNPHVKEVRMRIVAASADADVQLACESHGIELELFPAARVTRGGDGNG